MARKPVSAAPTKKFFVEMLTRDIELGDAILDLLDNCVDGVLRTRGSSKAAKPYDGFFASITLNKSFFEIRDNCGGIPEERIPYAFRIGRETADPGENIETIGVYGVGMKRAIFKMGREALVTTKNSKEQFSVQFTSEWMANDKNWDLPIVDSEDDLEEPGTVVKITKLLSTVQQEFDPEASAFIDDLKNTISGFFSFILEKGLKVSVNGDELRASDYSLLFPEKVSKRGEGPSINPYILEAEFDGVHVQAALGFYRPPAKESEIDIENLRPRSREEAGLSVACNDRVVLYKDKSRLVGWGTRGVPSFHNQFICIGGVIFFRSKDTAKLPLTTTKHGLDTSSDVYLIVIDLVAAALKKFTTFTNKWKGNEDATEDFFETMIAYHINDLFAKVPASVLKKNPKLNAYGTVSEWQVDLPIPKSENTNRRIVFARPIHRIRKVSRFLFDTTDVSPSEVGAKCFDLIHTEAGKKS